MYQASIYVGRNGLIIGAAQTDQAYTQHGTDGRTYCGKPVEHAGWWYGSQMSYAPYRRALAEARARLA